jgi:hypothetical protein
MGELRSVPAGSSKPQVRQSRPGVLVAKHDDAHTLPVTAAWGEAGAVEYSSENVIGKRVIGEFAHRWRGSHNVVKLHEHHGAPSGCNGIHAAS